MDLQSVLGFLLSVLSSLVFVGLLAFAGVYVYFRRQYRYWNNRNVKTTNPSFPLGDITEILLSKHIGTVLKDMYDRFSGEKYVGMWVLHKPYLMVRDPDLVRDIFVRDFNSFRDRGTNVNEEIDPLSANLFFLGGIRWRSLRTKLSPAFTASKARKMCEVMAEKGEKLRNVLRAAAEEETEIEVKEYAERYTHEVVASSFLGLQAGTIEDPDSAFRSLGRKIFEPGWGSIIKLGTSFLVPDLASLLRVVTIPKAVTEFFLQAVHDVMAFREASGVEPGDFMQMLLQLRNRGYLGDADRRGGSEGAGQRAESEMGKFTFQDAAAQAFVFWTGGFETSATTMQFALYEMSKNQGVQDRARDEVRVISARHGGKITYDALLEMEYLGRVIQETLRMYPPLTMLTRVCTRRYEIPNSDVVLERGNRVLVPVLGLHKDPKFFPEPERFDPERFTSEQKSARHHFAYIPFGEGPHTCIGRKFAIMQIKMGLANLLLNYKFEATGKTPENLVFHAQHVIYTVKNGIHLKISRIGE